MYSCTCRHEQHRLCFRMNKTVNFDKCAHLDLLSCQVILFTIGTVATVHVVFQLLVLVCILVSVRVSKRMSAHQAFSLCRALLPISILHRVYHIMVAAPSPVIHHEWFGTSYQRCVVVICHSRCFYVRIHSWTRSYMKLCMRSSMHMIASVVRQRLCHTDHIGWMRQVT